MDAREMHLKTAVAATALGVAVIWGMAPAPAAAACSTPSGIEGEMRYFSGGQAYKYCDGADWSPMGGSMPAGAIAAFEQSSCPAGWAAYAPAEGRFVVGAGSYASGADADGANPATSYAAGDTGGTMDEVLTTGEMPSHGHPGSALIASDREGTYNDDYPVGGTGYNSGVASYSQTAVSQGGDGAQENRPPYVALTWCEKQLDVDAVAGSSIDGLADVDTTSGPAPIHGSLLGWNSADSEWEPTTWDAVSMAKVHGAGQPGLELRSTSVGQTWRTIVDDPTGNLAIHDLTEGYRRFRIEKGGSVEVLGSPTGLADLNVEDPGATPNTVSVSLSSNGNRIGQASAYTGDDLTSTLRFGIRDSGTFDNRLRVTPWGGTFSYGSSEAKSALNIDNTGPPANNMNLHFRSEGNIVSRLQANTGDSQNGTMRFQTARSGTLATHMYITPDGDVMGAARSVGGAEEKICTGETTPGGGWVDYNTSGAKYVQVDISSCDFTTPPKVFTSLTAGGGSHFMATGVTSIYSITTNGFRVYVNWQPWNSDDTNLHRDNDWYVQWMAVGR